MKSELDLLREIASNLAMLDPYGGEHDELLADEAIEMAKQWHQKFSTQGRNHRDGSDI